ncbi:MAG: vWA domain-containing protein [Oligoflexus sp.]|jgi:hypothetical protein
MLARSLLWILSLNMGLLGCGGSPDFQGNVPQTLPNDRSEQVPPAPTPAPVTVSPQTPVPSDSSAVESEQLVAVIDKEKVSLKVDIVFAIDTSGSMTEETNAVQTNLGRMVKALNNGRLDPRVHLMLDRILTLPEGVDRTKLAFISQTIGSWNAISRLNLLFAGQFQSSYRDAAGKAMTQPLAFRPDAKLEIVVVSDDNGKGAGNLAADFDSKKKQTGTFNAIVGLSDSRQSTQCSLAAVGTEYLSLSAAMKGSVLDICSPNWDQLIDRLSADMIKRSVTFTLSQDPHSPKQLRVKLDQQTLPSEAWTYNETSRSLTLLKTDGIKNGSEIEIAYETRAK